MPTAEARLRTNFNATALWLASVETDARGRATAEVTFPDSLTSWKMSALACDRSTRVGQVREEVKTNKPIMVRPQGPRFFIEGDEVVLSAIVNNNTSESQMVDVGLDPKGLSFLTQTSQTGQTGPTSPTAIDASTEPVQAGGPRIRINVPANNQRRVDWRVVASAPGEAVITTDALATIDSDAVERTFTIYEYGIEKFLAQGATIREAGNDIEKLMTLTIPAERREGSEGMTIWIEPTLARTMVNALDYLAQYPYGCVEQTLSRFVPSVITSKVLQQLGLRRPALEQKLPDMIKTGLDRLYDFQHPDGGWAWWKEGDSDPFMSAYVLQGLGQAQEADVTVRPDAIARAANFLQQELVKFQDQEDMAAFLLYALASAGNVGDHRDYVDAAHERLWPRREELNPYTRALYALACELSGRHDRAVILARNIRNGLVEDAANGTAHWGESGVYYRWSQGGVEATAFSLRALLAIDPQSDMIDPAMTWLVRNRRGAQWKNTRDTAIVVRALADYITVRKEDQPNWTADVRVNGELIQTLAVTPAAVFDFDGKIEVPAEKLKTGDNTVTITRRGSGVLYASTWLTYFTREGDITAAGNEVFVQRKYFRTREEPTLAGAYRTVREEIQSGAELKSGDRVEVQLALESKNHYEYLVLEDLKAAGMEATEVQSGREWGGGLMVHRELRDERTAFFINQMPEGNHTLTYELRAEVPGVFHALPAQIHAMYVPEIRANSAGAETAIVD
jgi:hypothetical protein